ncbi:hypothetical protein V6N13_059812 [Hibiscus sabdariffa]|uniref:Uncharacterized protein n=2 Tax=Hibiscus sabdariffa TaxID=183260 RepID=A0ABR1ZBX7_9ROSI
MVKHIGWNIRIDLKIDFWRDSWVRDIGPLCEVCNDVLEGSKVTVASMVDTSGEWKWEVIQDLLVTKPVLLRIAAIKPPDPSHIDGTRRWM